MSPVDGRARERLVETENVLEMPAMVTEMEFVPTATVDDSVRPICGDSMTSMQSTCCLWECPCQRYCCDANSYSRLPMSEACVSNRAKSTDAGDDGGGDGKRATDLHRAPNYCLINWSACLVPTRTATMTEKKTVPDSCCPAATDSND